MNFWMMVLAVVVGIEVWDILRAFVMAIIEEISEKKQKRKIGFEGAESSRKTTKGVTMRKIGFGAND